MRPLWRHESTYVLLYLYNYFQMYHSYFWRVSQAECYLGLRGSQAHGFRLVSSYVFRFLFFVAVGRGIGCASRSFVVGVDTSECHPSNVAITLYTTLVRSAQEAAVTFLILSNVLTPL